MMGIGIALAPGGGSSGAVISVGVFSAAPSAKGLTIVGTAINMDPADATHPGGMSIVAQSFAGIKTFTDATDASSSTVGGTVVSGGLAIAKKANVGTDIAVGGNIIGAGATDSSSISTGAVTTAGGLGVTKKAYIGTGLSVGSGSLAASELFQLGSTTQGSRPMPSMTTAQRTAITPSTGLMVYDTDLKGPMWYDAAQWQFMGNSLVVAAAQAPAAAATPTILGYRNQILPLSGAAAAAVTLTDLSITNNLAGDQLILMGTSDSATVTVVSATNTKLNGTITLALNNTLTLVLYNSTWVEVARA